MRQAATSGVEQTPQCIDFFFGDCLDATTLTENPHHTVGFEYRQTGGHRVGHAYEHIAWKQWSLNQFFPVLPPAQLTKNRQIDLEISCGEFAHHSLLVVRACMDHIPMLLENG